MKDKNIAVLSPAELGFVEESVSITDFFTKASELGFYPFEHEFPLVEKLVDIYSRIKDKTWIFVARVQKNPLAKEKDYYPFALAKKENGKIYKRQISSFGDSTHSKNQKWFFLKPL